MSDVFWRDAASGSLIDPAMIPGTDIDGAVLSGVAAGFRDRGGLLVERAEAVLGDWGGLAPVYSAPEAPVLLAAMDPIRADVGVTAEKLARAADRIDDLAGLVAAPVRRLQELKVEAEEFVASVRGGVTVSGTDPDNPYYQAMMMTEGSAMGMAMAPEGHNSATINWSEHTPSVNRNNELIEQVNDEFRRIHNAVAECVNGITALIDGYCAPGMSTISDAQLAAMAETDYGSIGKGDRSCSESVGDGVLQAGTDMFAGIVSLGGGSFDEEWNWSHSWDTAGAAWSGMLQGLGAIAMIGVPSIALTVTPDEALPSGLRAVKDWHAQQMTGLVEGIVGDPEMWAEDPVAAGAFAVTNIGSFFIPVAGGAAAAGKVGTVAARAGMSTVRLGTRLDGAVSSSVVVNVGDLIARGGNTLTDLGRGSSAASRAELAGVLEAFEQTRVARTELSPPVGFGERMNTAVEQAAQFPARATEAMQHLGDRLGLHGGGGLLPAFADGAPGGGHLFDVEAPAPRADAVADPVRASETDATTTSIRPDTWEGVATPRREGLPDDDNGWAVPDRGIFTPTSPAEIPIRPSELSERVVESGGKGGWVAELNNPEPNTRYIVNDRFIYDTDSNGFVVYARAELDGLYPTTERNGYQQRVAGRGDRLPGDEGGHIWATIFGGPGEGININAMRDSLNSSGAREYWVLEAGWRERIATGERLTAEVEITRPAHPDGRTSHRPDEFLVSWQSSSGAGGSVLLDNTPIIPKPVAEGGQ